MDGRVSEVLPREFLCCPLCREELQDPKFLPCLHSFCHSCIDQHIQANCHSNGNFHCPICLTESTTTGGGASDLPDNLFAKRLSCPQSAARQREKICGHCQISGATREATTHCLNCDDLLCGQCALSHLDQEETASHKTQLLQDDIDSDIKVQPDHMPSALPRCCTLYDALDIGSMYCVDCETSLCADCHVNFHNDHKCAELSTISTNFDSKINQPMKELTKEKQTLHKALATLESVRNYAAQKQEEIAKTIKERTQVLCGLIHEYESVLLMETDKRHAHNLAMVEKRADTIHRHIESIKAVTDLTQKLLTFGTDEEKVYMRRHVGRRVRELCEVDLPTKHVRLTNSILSKPPVTVETICEMFGVLTTNAAKENNNKKSLGLSQSVDLGTVSRMAVSSAQKLTDLDEFEETEDKETISLNKTSDQFRVARHDTPRISAINDDSNATAMSQGNWELHEAPCKKLLYQSSVEQEDVPCINLETAKKEMCLPDTIARDCMKGVGVNSQGDIIVGTVSASEGSKVFILEKHGIVRGQITVEKNWVIHSIAADGKVSLVLPRGENRYKVKVMSGRNHVEVLADAQIESFGLNSVTATRTGILLAASSRYITTNAQLGRSAKQGGNITIYDPQGIIIKVITNETLSDLHPNLLDRPHSIATDHQGHFFVTDPGRHSIIGFKDTGDFLFEHGNTDAEEELYQGPDSVCTDRKGNVIVFDKKDSRIDILSYDGQLQRCYFPCEHFRFVCVTHDALLMLVNSAGELKFFDYF